MSRSNEFDGATCSECESPLHTNGYCVNEGCGFSAYFQDEPGGWRLTEERREAGYLLHFEEGCVVASAKTKKIYPPDSRHYKQIIKSRTAVFFRSEADAVKAGYAVHA
jgi:hypothetical protein